VVGVVVGGGVEPLWIFVLHSEPPLTSQQKLIPHNPYTHIITEAISGTVYIECDITHRQMRIK